jgi:hypothetical protein
MSCELVAQPPSAAPSATIPRTRILLIPRPADIQAQPQVESNTACAKDSRSTTRAGSNRSAMPSNLSQWKPQGACPATYRKSGPIQSLGNNLSATRTEYEIPEFSIPFERPRPSWRTFHFPFAFSPSAIVSARFFSKLPVSVWHVNGRRFRSGSSGCRSLLS